MSMNTSIVYGRGFNVDGVTDGTLKLFARNHLASLRACLSQEELGEIEEYLGCDDEADFPEVECGISCQRGTYAVISNVIREESGIQVQYEPGQEDCDSLPSILLAACLPWQYAEEEKLLTIQEYDDIISPYMVELGVSGNPDDLSVEYYG